MKETEVMKDRKHRRIAGGSLLTVAATAVVALLIGTSPQSDETAKARSPAPQSTGGYATQAKNLATRVYAADTAQKRYQAVLAVMRALKVGVYTGDGGQIVAGNEAGPNDFYLYQFEVKAIANALGRRSLTSVEQVAKELSKLTENEKISAVQLAGAMKDGAVEARTSPTQYDSLVALLARELGLKHKWSYDLAKGIAPKTPALDPLQAFLARADVTTTLGREARQSATTLRSSGPCNPDGFKGDAGKWVAFGKWVANKIPAVSNAVSIYDDAIDLSHAATLMDGIKATVKPADSKLKAAVGSPHRDPTGFSVTIRLEMKLDKRTREIIKCGQMAGMNIPKDGPLKKIPVKWFRPQFTLSKISLDDWGKVVCKDDGCRQTNRDGQATFRFTAGRYSKALCPKKDSCGLISTANGGLTAVPEYLSAFGNVPGQLVQYLVPKGLAKTWAVRNWCMYLPNGKSGYRADGRQATSARRC
jgi:hypothetical protein